MARKRPPAAKTRTGATSSRRGARTRAVREPSDDYDALPPVWRARDDPDRATPVLLDTHVWLWTLDPASGALRTAARAVVERASAAGRAFVSDFSCWELAMLVARGRLVLDADVDAWLDRAARVPGLPLRPVSRTVLVRSMALPGTFHGDPADRILLSHARSLGAALMTCDRGIVRYARATPGIVVCDAR